MLLRVLLSTQSDHSQWDLALGTVQLAINCRVNPDTGLSPQELTTVYIPTSPLSRWIQQPPLESLEPHNQTTDAGSIPDPHTVGNQPPPTRPTQTSDLDSPNLNPPSNHVYTKRRTIGNIPTKILDSYRVSHPHKIQSHIHYPKLDMTATLLARTIYAHSIISGKRAAYIRSQAVYNKHTHPLWPLGDHSIGLLVWRYIQKPVAKGFSKSLVSRWCAVWRINYVAGESFCCLESLFTIQGKTVYLDTSIALIWPFNQPNLVFPDTQRQRPYLDTRAGSETADSDIFEQSGARRVLAGMLGRSAPAAQQPAMYGVPASGGQAGCLPPSPPPTTTHTDLQTWPPVQPDIFYSRLSDPPPLIQDFLNLDDECTFLSPPVDYFLAHCQENTLD